jgi:hypothetical protein
MPAMMTYGCIAGSEKPITITAFLADPLDNPAALFFDQFVKLRPEMTDLDDSTQHLAEWSPDGGLGEESTLVGLRQCASRKHLPEFGCWLVTFDRLLECLFQGLLRAFEDRVYRAVGIAFDDQLPATSDGRVARILAEAVYECRKAFRKVDDLPLRVAFYLHAEMSNPLSMTSRSSSSFILGMRTSSQHRLMLS